MPRTVLVIEDNPVTRATVRRTLGEQGFHVIDASDGREALELASHATPDLILQDLLLPDVDGFELVGQLRALPQIEDVPIVAFSGFLSQHEYRLATSLGFSDFLPKPVEPSFLLQIVQSHLPAVRAQPGLPEARRVLVVDDNRVQLRLTRICLAELGFKVTTATTAADALRLIALGTIDAVISDVRLPQFDGFRLCAEIRKDPERATLPIVLVTSSYVHRADLEVARHVGANSLIARTPDLAEVIAAFELPLGPVDPLLAPDQTDAQHERVLRQHAREASMNAAFAHRAAMHASMLSVIAGISHLLTRGLPLREVLPDVLASLLEASGVPRGGLFLVEPSNAPAPAPGAPGTPSSVPPGALVLAASCGFADAHADELAAQCGQPQVFDAVVARRTSLVVGPHDPPGATHEVLRRLDGRSALLVPLVIDDRCLAVLVLVSSSLSLTEPDWIPFARSMSVHIGQALALSRSITALAASEARYRGIVETTNEGVWMVNTQLETTFLNARMAEMLGRDEADVLGRTPSEFLDEEALAAFGRDAERLRAGEAVQIEVRFVRPDGAEVWALLGSSPTFGADGRPSGALAMVMEVTERKRAERARTASEARFRRLWDSGMILIAIADAEGRIRDINNAGVQMLGYARSEVLSGGVTWPAITPERWRAADLAGLAELARTGVTAPWEKELICKDGRAMPILTSAARLDSDETILIAIDLSASKGLQAQLLQAQKMEAVGRLAGGIAHDFNNVLSVILSYGEMLVDELRPGDPMRADLEEICKAGHRAAGLTRQLLMFSRQQVIEPKVLDLNELLGDLGSMLRRLLGADIDLVLLPADGLGRILIDPGSIEQVVMNLIVNARDAMPTGGKLTIATGNVVLDDDYVRTHVGAQPGPHVMFSVTDIGHGMDAATRLRIFEPFFTTKPMGAGTGLGLATVFGIIHQGNGSIWVDSEPGVGTTFTLFLPRVDTAVGRNRVTERPPVSLRGSETILLVEDDEQVRQVARGILLRHGYVVLEASNAGEALLLSEGAGVIELLLSDVVMPQMSGPQLAKRLARDRPAMKLLCMSGYTDDSVVRHGVLEGEVAYLQKPFTPEALMRKVREVLDAEAALPRE